MIVKVQKIGNSKGVIFPKQIMALCSIESQVSITVTNNQIIIVPADGPRAGWEAQFKAADMGNKPENDFFEGMENEFDKNEWTW